MKRIIYFLIVVGCALQITGCKELFSKFGKKDYTLIVALEDANGLKKGVNVMYKGMKVGKLGNVRRQGSEVVGDLTFPKDFQIPKGSEFIVKQQSLFGKKIIELRFSEAVDHYADGDMVAITGTQNGIEGIFEDMSVQLDSVFGVAIDSLQEQLEKIEEENIEIVPKEPK
ncbi:MAG: MlaD family protein [Chitinophagales bacterium]|nr:MlaD family protein [Chitinophagales bacterium]